MILASFRFSSLGTMYCIRQLCSHGNRPLFFVLAIMTQKWKPQKIIETLIARVLKIVKIPLSLAKTKGKLEPLVFVYSDHFCRLQIFEKNYDHIALFCK